MNALKGYGSYLVAGLKIAIGISGLILSAMEVDGFSYEISMALISSGIAVFTLRRAIEN